MTGCQSGPNSSAASPDGQQAGSAQAARRARHPHRGQKRPQGPDQVLPDAAPVQGAEALLGGVEQQQQSRVAVGDLGRQVVDRLRGLLHARRRRQRLADVVQRHQFGIAPVLDRPEIGRSRWRCPPGGRTGQQLDSVEDGRCGPLLLTTITPMQRPRARSAGRGRLHAQRLRVGTLLRRCRVQVAHKQRSLRFRDPPDHPLARRELRLRSHPPPQGKPRVMCAEKRPVSRSPR